MKIPNELDVNTCKSPHCKNFSLPRCGDYIIPSFKLGFPSVHCICCGGNSLLINNKDLEKLLLPYVVDFNRNIENYCPRCMSGEKIRHGFTRKKTRRYKCKKCHYVYTPESISFNGDLHCRIVTLLLTGYAVCDILRKLSITSITFYRLLYKTSALLDRYMKTQQKHHYYNNCKLQTSIFKIACRPEGGTGLNNDLLGLVTCCSESGYVYLTSLNWDEVELSPNSRYQPSGLEVEHLNHDNNSIKNIYEKYDSLLTRPNFDHFNYTNKKCSSLVFQPIVLAHIHFQKIKPLIKCKAAIHYIYADPFIRSACISGSEISKITNENGGIYYIVSDKTNKNDVFIYKGGYKIGWWGNVWEEYYSPYTQKYKYICKLTNLDKPKLGESCNLSLDKAETFINAFKDTFTDKYIRKISPRVFISILRIFTAYFNYCYLNTGNTSCAAKKLGLINVTFNITTLLKAAEYSENMKKNG